MNKNLVSRKVFLRIIAAVAALFTLIPSNLEAELEYKTPSNKLNIVSVGDTNVCPEFKNLKSENIRDEKTRIYSVFTSGVVTGASYSIYHPNVEIIKNKEVLEILKEKCKEVEFIGENQPTEEKKIIESIKAQKEKIDGLLCLGSPSDELISIGLPVVAVFRLWGQWFPLSYDHNDYKGKKVVTSCLPVVPDKNRSVYLSRIEDIAGKIMLIDAISKMKGLRVLVVTDKPPLGVWEPYDFQIETSRKEYEKVFVNNLKETFGAFLVPIPQKDLVEKYKVQDEVKAKEITEKWINGASGIRGTNEAQILRSAKLYLAMKELMEEHNCGAIATEGYGTFPGHFAILPSQGLPSSQLCTECIVAVGETLLNSLITQQLGLNITGSTGQNGDYFIDFL